MTLTEMVPYEKIVPLQDPNNLRSSIYINEFIPSAGLAFLPTNGSPPWINLNPSYYMMNSF